jgi:hypothetical protein
MSELRSPKQQREHLVRSLRAEGNELKTFKMFSYWEVWPSSTGHAPCFDNLRKLVQLYECALSDLLVDLPDFRHLDSICGRWRASSAAEWYVRGGSR